MNKLLFRPICWGLALILGAWNPVTARPLERVEPAFWWVGMQHPQLQLLVYGQEIGQAQPSIAYAGVRIDRVTRVQSPNYLFIDLTLLDNQRAAEFTIDFKVNGKVVASYPYRLLARRPGSAERKGFDTRDVLYLITPDRFVNGDPSNDNHPDMLEKADRSNPGGRHGGDIAGMVKSLDYLRDLGFTAIWDNPVLENNMPDYSYHGYAITDFYRVDPRYGTNEAYQKMADLAREKGIKHIMDMIVNHCGSNHWWMKDLPTADWINYGGKFAPTNHKKSTIQDPYVAGVDYQGFVDGWFVATMPDLNQRNPLLATYLIQNAIWWIEFAGLDGIRMDTYPYPDKDFMTNWTCRIMQEYPHFNIVGEEWSGNPAIVAFWQKGKINPNGYTSCLPSLMDFPVQEALARALTDERSWLPLYDMVANDFLYPDPTRLVLFPDNHDMTRFITQVQGDPALFRLGLIYTLTAPRIPQIYYSTEIMTPSPVERNDGLIRSDFPGGWAGDSVNAFTGQGLSPEQRSAQAFLKKLLQWRNQATVIHQGKMKHYLPQGNLYTYFRYQNDAAVMVVLNKGNTAATLPLAQYQESLVGYQRGREVVSGAVITLQEPLSIPAKTGWIIELER